ncbi:MAG: hypothetical protein AAF513_07855, partial [Pseudomonadota bacterium]
MSASPTDPDPLDARFAHLTARISAACAAAGRDPDSVTLIGASKTQPAATLRAAHRLGLRHCGENYLDEALAKTTHLRDLDLTWHYIGRVQSNKTRHICKHQLFAYKPHLLHPCTCLYDPHSTICIPCF